jgi:hypothetical protein
MGYGDDKKSSMYAHPAENDQTSFWSRHTADPSELDGPQGPTGKENDDDEEDSDLED